MDTFDVIFTTYSPLVFRYLRSLCGDAAVADELTAETFYRAYTHFDSFRGDSKLETWLCAIAKNAYLKDCRRSARTVGADALETQPSETDFVERFLDREQAQQIYRHVHELGAQYKGVFAAHAQRAKLPRHCGHLRQVRIVGEGHVLSRQKQNHRTNGGIDMNPITCGMAADLLPLYLDGCCSVDSRAALEAHMDACPACRAQYAQLRRDLTPAAPAAEDPGTDGIARALARKMRRRKRCQRALCAVLGVLLAVFLVFIGKTFVILGQSGSIASAALPAGATDLAGRAVSGSAEEVGAYVFATGTARLVVSADALPDAPMTVRLWQVGETRENTMVATLDARHRSCIFTNLPPQTFYAVTVDGAPDVQLTVRSRLTFREAFSLMLQEL